MKQETEYQRSARINRLNKKANACILASWEKRRKEDPDFLSKVTCGYVIDRGGPHGLDIKKPVFSFCKVHDEGTLPRRSGTHLVLTFCLGSLQWLLYADRDVVMGSEAAKYARMNLLSETPNFVE